MIISGEAREQKLHCNLFVFLKTDNFCCECSCFLFGSFFFNLCCVLVFGHQPNNTALSLLLSCIGEIRTVVTIP